MGMTHNRWKEFIHFLIEAHHEARPLPARIPLLVIQTIVRAITKFKRDLCFESASSLSFISIVSLIPAGFLFFFFMRAFGLHTYSETIKNFLLQNFVQETQQSLEEWLNIFEKNPLSSLQTLPLYILAISALIFSALWLLEASEKTFNRIWKTARQRSYIQRFTIFWVIVTTSPFFLALSAFLKKQLESNFFFSTLTQTNLAANTFYGFFLPVFLASLGFFFVFLLLPATKVKILPALFGAVFAGLCWEIAKRWLIYFVPKAVTFSVYGSLGAVAAFFIWVYVTWGILLLGAQISFVIQYPATTLNFLKHQKEHYQLPPGFSVLSVALEAARAASLGIQPPSLSKLSHLWSYPENVLVQEMLDHSPQLFHASSENEDVYYLSKDSDKILIRDLLPAHSDPDNNILTETHLPKEVQSLITLLDQNEKKALDNLTLRDLLERNICLRTENNS